MPENTGEHGREMLPQRTASEWEAAIRNNPDRFPMLNHYIRMGESYADREGKIKEYRSRKAPDIPIVLTTAVLAFLAAKRIPFTQGPMTRRKFLKTAATGFGLATVGRVADVWTTRSGLLRFETGLREIRESEEFQKLPEEVGQKLLPPIEALETNPYQDQRIGELKSPALAVKAVAKEAATGAAGAGLAGAVYRLGQVTFRSLKHDLFPDKKQKERMEVGRRAFLAVTAAMTAGFLYVASSNQRTERFLREHPAMVKAELRELHRMMETKRGMK